MSGMFLKLLSLLLALPSIVHCRQNRSGHLRTSVQRLVVEARHAASLLDNKRGTCTCVYKDDCSCQGALEFMTCVKAACSSGDCDCIEGNGVDHYTQSCEAMSTECSGLNMWCAGHRATCGGESVVWDAKVSEPEDGVSAAKANQPTPAKIAEHRQPAEPAEPQKRSVEPPKPKPQTAERVEHHPKAEHSASSGKEEERASHRSFASALLLIISVSFLMVPALAGSDEDLQKHTWNIIDMCVCWLVAVCWFMVIIRGIDYFQLSGVVAIGVHLTLSFVLLFFAIRASWHLREKDWAMASYNATATPLIKWFTIGGMHAAMAHAYRSGGGHAFVLFAILYAGLVVAALNRIKPKHAFGDAIENAVLGGALSACLTLAIITIICGGFQEMSPPRKHPASYVRILGVLFSGALCLAIALIAVPKLPQLRDRYPNNYWWQRACGISAALLTMMPCFTFATGLSQLTVDVWYKNVAKSIDARLVNVAISIIVAAAIILFCSKFLRKTDQTTTIATTVLITLAGFLPAVAWAHLLENSISASEPNAGDALMSFTGLAIFLSVLVIPVYFMYIKPFVMSKAQPRPAVQPSAPPSHSITT